MGLHGISNIVTNLQDNQKGIDVSLLYILAYRRLLHSVAVKSDNVNNKRNMHHRKVMVGV